MTRWFVRLKDWPPGIPVTIQLGQLAERLVLDGFDVGVYRQEGLLVVSGDKDAFMLKVLDGTIDSRFYTVGPADDI